MTRIPWPALLIGCWWLSLRLPLSAGVIAGLLAGAVHA